LAEHTTRQATTGDGASGDDNQARSSAVVRSSPARAARVLVVDDEPAVGRTIKRLLGEPHEVTVLVDGKQAIELLVSGAGFDVILCDLTMPEVSGIEVYRAAVNCDPRLGSIFVFMTGGTFTASARQFLDDLPNERLDKPFDVEAVRELVRKRVGPT
jgi:two-component system cell cycle sensor histidine kinase/response regulator CckA